MRAARGRRAEERVAAAPAPPAEQRQARHATAGGPGQDGGAAPELKAREETERAFLALCLASPAEGAVVLAAIDLEQHFASP